MKRSVQIATLLLLIAVMSGCKKFLDEKTFTNLNQTIFPKSEGDLRVLCNGLYNMFEANEHYGRSYLIISDLFTDELTTTALSGPRYEIQNALITPGNSELAQAWSRNYTIIARANVIVEQAPTVPIPAAAIQPYIAEARFVRALCYFEMVKFFGDVPLVLKQPTNIDSLQALKPSRSPQKDVYKQIVEDLKFAEMNLKRESLIPSTYKGVASSGAATSLLAKVYLTRAYMPFAETNDFANAADACNRVISSGDYGLFASYRDVFDVNRENGTEHIFSIQYDQAPNRTSGITGFLTPAQVYPRSFGSFPAERKFYDAFPSSDAIRKKFVFYDQGASPINGAAYDFISNSATNPYCGKYRDDVLAQTSFNDRCNYPILRFADVLLMQSEALNRINPGDPNKYTGINRVRVRVNLAPLSGLSQAAFENAVLDERHWELCFEGKRRDDMIRMGRMASIMNSIGYPNFKEFNRYYPVPQTEIDINPNLLPQNPGY